MCVHPIFLKERQCQVPCGFCVECRSRYRREWALRCMHEASLHEANAFGTLTYSDEFLPKTGSLDRRAFTLFMKRLRKSVEPQKVRYYASGEYGELNGRPHYHFLLFGYDFPDKEIIASGTYPLFRSASLEKLWPFGLSTLGSVSFSSASYVAAYVMKKVDRVGKKPHFSRSTGVRIEPEYSVMSRRPGIGYDWYRQYGEESHRHDSVVLEGKEISVPRYYDSLLDDSRLEAIKERRCDKRRFVGPVELKAREKIALAKEAL